MAKNKPNVLPEPKISALQMRVLYYSLSLEEKRIFIESMRAHLPHNLLPQDAGGEA